MPSIISFPKCATDLHVYCYSGTLVILVKRDSWTFTVEREILDRIDPTNTGYDLKMTYFSEADMLWNIK